MTYHIAVDIGASSGRLILADFEKNKWKLSELHRFKNGFHFSQGHDRWDVEELFRQIIVGLEKAKQRGIEKCTLGIDTWAIDYVLLKGGRALAQPIAYRDKRTEGAKEEVFVDTPAESIYKKTGIQFLNFNTLFQYVREDRELLKQAELSLLIPDYLAFRLTIPTIKKRKRNLRKFKKPTTPCPTKKNAPCTTNTVMPRSNRAWAAARADSATHKASTSPTSSAKCSAEAGAAAVSKTIKVQICRSA